MQKVSINYGGKKPLIRWMYWDEIEEIVFEGFYVELVH